jgi:hypothetical protein
MEVKVSKKYRKKPVVIQAVQWQGTQKSWDKIMAMGLIDWLPGEMGSRSFYMNTLEGKVKIECNDFIIKGVLGEFYSCKPDIFEKIYKLIEENKKIPIDES